MKLEKLKKNLPDADPNVVNLINQGVSLYNKLSKQKITSNGELIFELTKLQELVSELAASIDSLEIRQLLAFVESDIRDICIRADLTQTELLIEHLADPNISALSSSKPINIDKMKLPLYQVIKEYAKASDKKAKATFLGVLHGIADDLKSSPSMKNQERMKLEGQKVGLMLHQQEESLIIMESKHSAIAINRDDKNVEKEQLATLGKNLGEILAPQDGGGKNIKVECLGVGNNRVYRISIKKDGQEYTYACIAASYVEEDAEVDKAVFALKQSESSASYIASPIDTIMLPSASARYFLFTWYTQGDVERYLIKMKNEGAPLLERLAKVIGYMKDTTKMIYTFRECKVLISDVKPANLLINDDGSISLTDWKSLSTFNPELEQQGQLRWLHFSSISDAYAPPERLDKKGPVRCPSGEKIQVFSLGMCLYQSILGISSEMLNELVQHIGYDEGGYKQFDFSDPAFTEYEALGNEIKGLIRDSTQQDYSKRPSLEECQARYQSIMAKIPTLEKSHSAAPVKKVNSNNNLGFFSPQSPNLSSSQARQEQVGRIDLTQIQKSSSQEGELLRSRGSLKKQSNEDLSRFKKTDSQGSESPLRESLKKQSHENLSRFKKTDSQENESPLRESLKKQSHENSSRFKKTDSHENDSPLRGSLSKQSNENLSQLGKTNSQEGKLVHSSPLHDSQNLPSSPLIRPLEKQSAHDFSELKKTLKSSNSGNLKSSSFFSIPNQQENNAEQIEKLKEETPEKKGPKTPSSS